MNILKKISNSLMNKECIKCIRCESPKYENGFLTLQLQVEGKGTCHLVKP